MLFHMDVKLCHFEGRKEMEDVREQDAEENI
jgi:hypothetical protein